MPFPRILFSCFFPSTCLVMRTAGAKMPSAKGFSNAEVTFLDVCGLLPTTAALVALRGTAVLLSIIGCPTRKLLFDVVDVAILLSMRILLMCVVVLFWKTAAPTWVDAVLLFVHILLLLQLLRSIMVRMCVFVQVNQSVNQSIVRACVRISCFRSASIFTRGEGGL